MRLCFLNGVDKLVFPADVEMDGWRALIPAIRTVANGAVPHRWHSVEEFLFL